MLTDLGAVAWASGDTAGLGSREDATVVLVSHAAPVTPALVAVLSAEELAAAERHKTPAARDRAIVSRAGLRLLLSRYADVAPQALEIGVEHAGKPVLRGRDSAGRAINFSVSHAGDCLLYAVGRMPVGIDIEYVAPIPDLDAFTRVALGERERADFVTLPHPDRLEHVYRIWVCKEALAKLTGEGLRTDFAFDLPQEGGPNFAVFTPAPGYVAALATHAEAGSARFLRTRIETLLG